MAGWLARQAGCLVRLPGWGEEVGGGGRRTWKEKVEKARYSIKKQNLTQGVRNKEYYYF